MKKRFITVILFVLLSLLVSCGGNDFDFYFRVNNLKDKDLERYSRDKYEEWKRERDKRKDENKDEYIKK